MRKYIILFFLTIILASLFVVLLNLLNPIDEEAIYELALAQRITAVEELRAVIGELTSQGLIIEYLNLRNVLIVAAVGLGAIICGLSLIHLVVDRLFLRQFYEQASLKTALRRSSFVATAIAGVAFMHLIATPWYVVLAFLTIILLLEVIITRAFAVPPEIVSGYELEQDKIERQTKQSLLDRFGASIKRAVKQVVLAVLKAYISARKQLGLKSTTDE